MSLSHPTNSNHKAITASQQRVGNIFTLELHVIVPNRGMMSLEEDVLVTENGVEYLGRPQTSLRYIR